MRYEPVLPDELIEALTRHKHLWSNGNGHVPGLEVLSLNLISENLRRAAEMITAMGFLVAREVSPRPRPTADNPPESGWHAWVVVKSSIGESAEWYGPYSSRDIAGVKGYTRASSERRSNPPDAAITYQVFNGRDPVSPPRDALQRWTKAWSDKARRTCQYCQYTIVDSGGAWLIVDSGPEVDGLSSCHDRPTGKDGYLRNHRPLRGPARAQR